MRVLGTTFGFGILLQLNSLAVGQILRPDERMTITFFDVSELPARIDEPKLEKANGQYALHCGIVNRSSEQLLGVRLELMIIDRSGRLSSRTLWSEPTELSAYTIKPFTLSPPIKEDIGRTDRLFLILDEVIGHETIWQVVEAERTLRAYARGQHDAMPKVRKVENKFDRPNDIFLLPIKP